MKKVLVVDDEEFIREIITEILKFEGIETLEAKNGLEALSVLANNQIDLVLSDIRMPDLDGYQMLKKIQEVASADMPVIFITGYSDYSDQKLMIQGAKQIIQKPFTGDSLLLAVKYALL